MSCGRLWLRSSFSLTLTLSRWEREKAGAAASTDTVNRSNGLGGYALAFADGAGRGVQAHDQPVEARNAAELEAPGRVLLRLDAAPDLDGDDPVEVFFLDFVRRELPWLSGRYEGLYAAGTRAEAEYRRGIEERMERLAGETGLGGLTRDERIRREAVPAPARQLELVW